MPSGHSATVTAMALTAAYEYGTGSFQFAMLAILAIIVMHDAMGVRQETGKQAVVLNQLMELLNPETFTDEQKMKEFVGHTPLQVFFGFLLGVVVAVLHH